MRDRLSTFIFSTSGALLSWTLWYCYPSTEPGDVYLRVLTYVMTGVALAHGLAVVRPPRKD